ncbi:MAG: twin-arginine translocase TatA/TatE family subunit [Lentisphaeria bacterium]
MYLANIGFSELLVILVVVLLVFGAKRIPDLAKALGRASHEYKKAKDELAKESEELLKEGEKHATAQDQAEAADVKAEKNR